MLLLNMPFLFMCQQIKLQSINVIIVLMHAGTDRSAVLSLTASKNKRNALFPAAYWSVKTSEAAGEGDKEGAQMQIFKLYMSM